MTGVEGGSRSLKICTPLPAGQYVLYHGTLDAFIFLSRWEAMPWILVIVSLFVAAIAAGALL